MMKKISLVLALVFSVFISTAQTWTNVNGRWGYEWLRAPKALFIPSGNGAPSGTASLNGALYKGQAALYSDTTNKKLYMFNAKDSTWTDVTGSGGGGTVQAQQSLTGDGSSGNKLRLLNDATTLGRNQHYGTLNNGTRGWSPSYHSFIDKYYADTATDSQTNVGGTSTVHLSNGTWLTAYTGFGTDPEDGGASTLYAINSNDNLRTFYNKRQIVALDTLEAHFGPSLYVKGINAATGDTVLLIWATQISAVAYGYVGDIRSRQSNDGGNTWGAISILHQAAGEYYNNFPNRIFRTNSGKLLYPFEKLRPGHAGPGDASVGFDPLMLISTNDGDTWTASTAIPTAVDTGTVETGFYQRPGESTVHFFGRSKRKYTAYHAESTNDAVTWNTPDYMNLFCPDAAVSIRYLRKQNLFIGFTNSISATDVEERRKVLSAYISSDGKNFQEIFVVDTSASKSNGVHSAGVIGLSDIIEIGDTSLVVIYSSFDTTSPQNRGSVKVARIPKSMLNYSLNNPLGGLPIPAGGTADRVWDGIPNLRKNVNSGFYESSLGDGLGYADFLQVGNTVTSTYPFWQVNLKSNNHSGSLTLLNQDNTTATYNSFETVKLFNNSGNLGEGTTAGTYGFQTQTRMRGISSAFTDPDGYSTIDWTLWAKNAAGVNREMMRFTAEGRMGIFTDVPTAKLHIAAGSTTANSAPLKFTSGAPTTTPETGAIHFSNGLLIADSSNSVRDTLATRSWARNNITGGAGSGSFYSIDKQYTNTQNSGSSATDMFSKTIDANQLASDGNELHFETSGFEVDATATMNLSIIFNGTSIGATSPLTLAGTTNWVIRGKIIRTSSSTARSDITISVDDGTTRDTYINSAVLSGLDFTSTIVLKLVATAGGAGASTGDIIGHLWLVDFEQ